MKCRNCKSCLNAVRADVGKGYDEYFWICDLCYNVYRAIKKRQVSVDDEETRLKVKEKFLELINVRRRVR